MTSAAFEAANDQLASFGITLATRSTISEAVTAAGVDVDAKTLKGYVSITTGGASRIALYVQKNDVSVALDPEDASHAAATHAYCRLEPADESSPTRYLKIDHGPVRLYSPVVRELFVTALKR
jgi:hypothetical protein